MRNESSPVAKLQCSSQINTISNKTFGIELGTDRMPDNGIPNKHVARTFPHYLSPVKPMSRLDR